MLKSSGRIYFAVIEEGSLRVYLYIYWVYFFRLESKNGIKRMKKRESGKKRCKKEKKEMKKYQR